jgi:hypothetical protein
MDQYINIEQKEISLSATKISIDVLLIELNIRAIIRVRFYSSDSKLLDTDEFVLDGDEYADWNNDDYLIDYVCDKYNISLSTIE